MQKSINITDDLVNSVESILTGIYYPLQGFLNKKDHKIILKKKRLSNGTIFPVPIVFPVDFKTKESVKHEKYIFLRNKDNYPIAKLYIEEIYRLKSDKNRWYISGKLKKVNELIRFDFIDIRLSPEKMRIKYGDMYNDVVIGYSVDRILYKYDIKAIEKVMEEYDAKIIIQQIIDPANLIHDYHTIIKCNKQIIEELNNPKIVYNVLPINPIDSESKLDKIVIHGIVHKNYGCKYYVERISKKELDIENIDELLDEIDIKYIPIKSKKYPTSKEIIELFRREEYDLNFMFDSTIETLKKSIVPYKQRGICIHFIGLLNSGKRTLANAVESKLIEQTGRMITILDGKTIATKINSDLTIDDRDAKNKRIVYLAKQLVNNRGIVIYNSIETTDDQLKYFRESISEVGLYLEVFVNTPLNVCEKRDTTGLYKLARKDAVDYMVGINRPFIEPKESDIILNNYSDLFQNVNTVVDKIVEVGYM